MSTNEFANYYEYHVQRVYLLFIIYSLRNILLENLNCVFFNYYTITENYYFVPTLKIASADRLNTLYNPTRYKIELLLIKYL